MHMLMLPYFVVGAILLFYEVLKRPSPALFYIMDRAPTDRGGR